MGNLQITLPLLLLLLLLLLLWTDVVADVSSKAICQDYFNGNSWLARLLFCSLIHPLAGWLAGWQCPVLRSHRRVFREWIGRQSSHSNIDLEQAGRPTGRPDGHPSGHTFAKVSLQRVASISFAYPLFLAYLTARRIKFRSSAAPAPAPLWS